VSRGGETASVEWQEVVRIAGETIDFVGVAILVIGLGVALGSFLLRAVRGDRSIASYRTLRRGTGRGILLGLEFLVAGDIIRTVAGTPTFESVGVLAAIVGIRTFLAFTLELEVSGRWPWQQATDSNAV
jgi:uncharacterized membrane protein